MRDIKTTTAKFLLFALLDYAPWLNFDTVSLRKLPLLYEDRIFIVYLHTSYGHSRIHPKNESHCR